MPRATGVWKPPGEQGGVGTIELPETQAPEVSPEPVEVPTPVVPPDDYVPKVLWSAFREQKVLVRHGEPAVYDPMVRGRIVKGRMPKVEVQFKNGELLMQKAALRLGMTPKELWEILKVHRYVQNFRIWDHDLYPQLTRMWEGNIANREYGLDTAHPRIMPGRRPVTTQR